MYEHVFDPDAQSQPLTVVVQPGVIHLGETNFLDPRDVVGYSMTPIQAALLILTLTRAIEAELAYSVELEEHCKRRPDDDDDMWEEF